jgi:hypothetical protein
MAVSRWTVVTRGQGGGGHNVVIAAERLEITGGALVFTAGAGDGGRLVRAFGPGAWTEVEPGGPGDGLPEGAQVFGRG